MIEYKTVHIVAFNIPYPPDYGGVIDVYYKIKSLSETGINVILHAFTYGRENSPELESLCKEVHYYQRKSGIRYFFGSTPYIVSTRNTGELTDRLLADKYPVLFEGLHTTASLPACRRSGKLTLVRTHNIEHRYYRMLAKSERRIFHKIYLGSEARKLKKYESVLSDADHLLSISTTDATYFRENFGSSHFVPAFHQYEKVESIAGKGDYILFHGNLSVPENESAILYLISKVLSKVNFRVVIAGKDPGSVLVRICNKYPHLELLPNLTNDNMARLIREAHINLLYTYQPTGLKLKLLHSLYAGRYCLTNPLMLSGSGLDELCHIYNQPSQAITMINQLMETRFPGSMITERRKVLQQFSNSSIVERITELL